MPSLINRVPPGLLSLLDIKALGQNPSLLSDTVQPTLDVLNFYARSYGQLVTDFSNIPAAVGFLPVTAFDAGPGEIVICAGVCIIADATLAAGTTVRWRGVVADAATGRLVSTVGERVNAAAGEQLSSGTDELVIVPTGNRLGVMVEQLTLGTGPRARISARIIRLLV